MKDKVFHFLAGLVIFFVGYFLIGKDFGLMMAAVAGISKEVIWDFIFDKGRVSLLDFVSTALPAVVLWFIL